MESLDFFIDIILPAAVWSLGLTQPLTEMSTRNVSWGWRRPVRRVDNLITFRCRLSWNLGASTSWNPQGLSRPVMGLLYFINYFTSCRFTLRPFRNKVLCVARRIGITIFKLFNFSRC